MDRLRKEVQRLADGAENAGCPAPKTGQVRAVGCQSHHPRQSEAWQRADRAQAPRAQPEAQAGRDLRREHLDALLLRADAKPAVPPAGPDQQDPCLCLYQPAGIHLAGLRRERSANAQ